MVAACGDDRGGERGAGEQRRTQQPVGRASVGEHARQPQCSNGLVYELEPTEPPHLTHVEPAARDTGPGVVGEAARVGGRRAALDLQVGRGRRLLAQRARLQRGDAVLLVAGVVEQVHLAAGQRVRVDHRVARAAHLARGVRVAAAAAALVVAGEAGVGEVGHRAAVEHGLAYRAADPLLVVQVGAADSAGGPGLADLLAQRHLLPDLHLLRGQVRVAGGVAAAVVDLDPPAVAVVALVVHTRHRAARGRQHRHPGDARLLEVDRVRRAVPGEGGRGDRGAAPERHLKVRRRHRVR